MDYAYPVDSGEQKYPISGQFKVESAESREGKWNRWISLIASPPSLWIVAREVSP